MLDTKELAELFEREIDSRLYTYFKIAPAYYASNTLPISEAFPKLIEMCERFISNQLTREKEYHEDVFSDFIEAATLYKHPAFHEEAEIRLAAVTASAEFRDVAAVEQQVSDLPPVKPVVTLDNGRRHITLLEDLKVPLPIRRVIVGPSRNQQELYEFARQLLGPDANIALSATPYIEPASA